MVGFGWFRFNSVGFSWFRLVSVGFGVGWLLSASASFIEPGWVSSLLVVRVSFGSFPMAALGDFWVVILVVFIGC